jgi:hypothetical protein
MLRPLKCSPAAAANLEKAEMHSAVSHGSPRPRPLRRPCVRAAPLRVAFCSAVAALNDGGGDDDDDDDDAQDEDEGEDDDDDAAASASIWSAPVAVTAAAAAAAAAAVPLPHAQSCRFGAEGHECAWLQPEGARGSLVQQYHQPSSGQTAKYCWHVALHSAIVVQFTGATGGGG